MATITIDASDVAPVVSGTLDGTEYFTAPSEEALTAGQFSRMNTSTGFQALGNATTAGEAGSGNPRRGLAINTVAVNETTTFIKKGLLNVGSALSALAYGAPVYLSDTDGRLEGGDDGTTTVIVGYVVPAFGATTPDKLLYVNL